MARSGSIHSLRLNGKFGCERPTIYSPVFTHAGSDRSVDVDSIGSQSTNKTRFRICDHFKMGHSANARWRTDRR